MEPYGTGCYFEDLPVGKKFSTIGRTITEADLVAFCNCTGLTGELFTNHEYQKTKSVMKGRPAPGLLAFIFCEGFVGQGPIRGNGLALLNLQINFEGPVYLGDTVHCEVEIIEARISKSRNDAGLVRFQQRVVKQDGTTAVSYTSLRMIRRKSAPANETAG